MNGGDSRIGCWWQRTFGEQQAAWLITLSIHPQFCASHWTCFPQARAVVDDFGTLVVVREWR